MITISSIDMKEHNVPVVKFIEITMMMMWPHHTEVTGTFALLFTLTRVNIALLSRAFYS